MFDKLSLDEYYINFELQRSQLFKDCLSPEIDFQLKDDVVIIFKKLDSGISEEISVDELIYFIHFEVAEYITEELKKLVQLVGDANSRQTPVGHFRCYYTVIDNIRNAVQNMRIILKYDKGEEEEDEGEEEEDEEKEEEKTCGKESPLMKEVSTKEVSTIIVTLN
jgi:hypothetical protein